MATYSEFQCMFNVFGLQLINRWQATKIIIKKNTRNKQKAIQIIKKDKYITSLPSMALTDIAHTYITSEQINENAYKTQYFVKNSRCT